MPPTLPLPTDNIYKFSCLFGLVLIVTAIFSYVATYSFSLDRKVRFSEIVIPLAGKQERTKVEEDVLVMNKKLIDVTHANERTAYGVLVVVLVLGILLSVLGAYKWHKVVHKRDTELAELQVRKLAAEVRRLEAEAGAAKTVPSV